MEDKYQLNRDINWVNGTWKDPSRPQRTAQVIITSDWAPIRNFAPIIAGSPAAVYGDLMTVLQEGDLRITNLECPLTSQQTAVSKSGSVLKGLPEHIRGLTAVPFEIVTLGNNHVFDYGLDGFQETIQLLDHHRIKRVGAGLTAEEARGSLVLDIKGVRLGLINFSEGEDLTAAGHGPGVLGWELDQVISAVTALKKGVDVVLVICHCGVEYIAFPPVYVARAFQRIADAGADMIIGHHPHVPQGIQIHHGVPICYSLGNFVFYQETDLIYRKTGYLLRAGLSPGGISELSVIPYEIMSDRLSLLKEKKLEWFYESLKKISVPLEDNRNIEAAWHAFLRRYGINGFQREIGILLDTMAKEPLKGAAMFRNRIATMQHNQHWIDALTRFIDGTIEDAPLWAMELTEQWLTQTL